MSPLWLALASGLLAWALASGPGRTLVVASEGPYTELAAALAAARDGDTVEVHGGIHPGPVVVRGAVALVGQDRPVIDGGGRGSVVTFEEHGGTLRGFLVRNSGNSNHKEDSAVLARGTVTLEDNRFEDVLYGVDIKAGPGSIVRGNRITSRDLDVARRGDGIRMWESHDGLVEGNTVSGARDVVIWYSSNVTVRNNEVVGGRYGLHFMYSSGSTVTDNLFADNAVGAYAMYSNDLAYERNRFVGSHGPSGYGVALKDSDNITLRDNAFVANRTGLYLDNSPHKPHSRNQIAGNTIAYNDIGISFMPAVKGNVLAANNFVDNFQQVALLAGGNFEGNDWTPGGAGNYWSGYAGYDADDDGLGEMPYHEVSLFNDLVRRHPALRLFTLSPAQQALDLAAEAFPVFRPPPVLTDTAPRVLPAPVVVLTPAVDRRPLLAASLTLVVMAAAAGAWGLALDRPRSTALSSGRGVGKALS